MDASFAIGLTKKIFAGGDGAFGACEPFLGSLGLLGFAPVAKFGNAPVLHLGFTESGTWSDAQAPSDITDAHTGNDQGSESRPVDIDSFWHGGRE
jgi:hypothetical protein